MSRRNSRAQRQIACMPCQAVEIEKRHGKIRADTGFIQGMAHAEVYEVQRLFEGLCPTHRNTYRLMRDAIDKQADAETTNAQALDLAIAKAAEEGKAGVVTVWAAFNDWAARMSGILPWTDETDPKNFASIDLADWDRRFEAWKRSRDRELADAYEAMRQPQAWMDARSSSRALVIDADAGPPPIRSMRPRPGPGVERLVGPDRAVAVATAMVRRKTIARVLWTVGMALFVAGGSGVVGSVVHYLATAGTQSTGPR